MMPFPSVDEDVLLASLYAYFDESGKHADHNVVVFSGFVDKFESWKAFADEWLRWLRHYRIPFLHTASALRYSQPCGTMRVGNAKDRAEDLLPFIQTITESLELAVIKAIDVKAYRSADSLIHRAYGADPHYFGFYMAIVEMLRHFEIPKDATIGLICDDEEQKSIECYKLLKRLKLAYPEVRQRITSICFSDDKAGGFLQASDLFAHLSRLEAQRRFLGKPYEYEQLFHAFERVSPTGHHLHFAGGFYTSDEFADFAHRLRADMN